MLMLEWDEDIVGSVFVYASEFGCENARKSVSSRLGSSGGAQRV